MSGEGEGLLPINGSVLALVVIFIPGIICYGIIASLAYKKQRDTLTIFLQIFMYGISSYLIPSLIHTLFPSLLSGFKELVIFHPSKIEKSINAAAVVIASSFGAAQGLIITVNLNREYLMRFLRHIKLTSRTGDADIWSFLLNSYDTDNWVTVRHEERSLIYQGYVQAFSSGDEKRELLLTEVSAFHLETAAHVGSIPVLYLAFAKDDGVLLEFGAKPDHPAPTERHLT